MTADAIASATGAPSRARRVRLGPACVQPGELLRHDPEAPCDIHCSRGAVWVTIDGDRRDVVLGPGQWLAVRERQPVLIMGLEGAAIRIEAAVGAAWRAAPPQRWWTHALVQLAQLAQRWRRGH